jgi:carbamoyl-phosphate synthase large subunit
MVALLSLADRDKPFVPRLAEALRSAGYRFAATAGTRDALRDAGFDAELVTKLGEADRDPDRSAAVSSILEAITSGRVRLVVNTPTPSSGPVRDAAYLRHAATAEGILCLTAVETAIAAAEALDPQLVARLSEVRSLQSWVPPRDGRAVAEPAA